MLCLSRVSDNISLLLYLVYNYFHYFHYINLLQLYEINYCIQYLSILVINYVMKWLVQ